MITDAVTGIVRPMRTEEIRTEFAARNYLAARSRESLKRQTPFGGHATPVADAFADSALPDANGIGDRLLTASYGNCPFEGVQPFSPCLFRRLNRIVHAPTDNSFLLFGNRTLMKNRYRAVDSFRP